MKCSIQNTGAEITDPEVHVLRNGGQEGISLEPNALRTGQNGGYQAINLALLAGAAKVVLLGYDMKYAPDGRSHWHKGHPTAVPAIWYEQTYARHYKAFEGYHVPVVNCSKETVLKLPRMSIEEALAP